MAETALFVIDASAALKWHFQTEEGSRQAVDLKADYVSGRVSLIGPPHLPFEVANAIRQRVLLQQMTSEIGRQILIDFLAVRIPLLSPDGVVGVAYDLALR